MTVFILVFFFLFLLAISFTLWKSGLIGVAEKPRPVIDRPVMDEKERKAVLKRIRRWKDEGKLSRQEYERFYELCSQEWDESATVEKK